MQDINIKKLAKSVFIDFACAVCYAGIAWFYYEPGMIRYIIICDKVGILVMCLTELMQIYIHSKIPASLQYKYGPKSSYILILCLAILFYKNWIFAFTYAMCEILSGRCILVCLFVGLTRMFKTQIANILSEHQINNSDAGHIVVPNYDAGPIYNMADQIHAMNDEFEQIINAEAPINNQAIDAAQS